jgi:hypothetical protein
MQFRTFRFDAPRSTGSVMLVRSPLLGTKRRVGIDEAGTDYHADEAACRCATFWARFGQRRKHFTCPILHDKDMNKLGQER